MVLAPNKTLAAQLYGEFQEFFPQNAVEYFVSYYDYYQPEAYVPQRDPFIEKDCSINEHIEQMRLSATKALLERRDVVIVASVSAIYGLGNPSDYHQMVMTLRVGDKVGQRDVIQQLARMQYTRNEMDFARGDLPRARRRDRHLPGRALGSWRCASSCSTTRWSACRSSIRSPGRDPAEDAALHRLPEQPLRDAARAACWRRSRRSRRSCASAWRSSSRKASWWKRSAWSSAPASTWR